MIKEVFWDAECYSHEVIDYLDDEKVRWAMLADQYEAAKKRIQGIREGERKQYETQDGIVTDREMAETVND